jgi:hypothetical protein
MSKGMEALEYISHFTCFWDGYYKDKLDAIEKELKAFEIIKKKGLDTIIFNNLNDYDEYLEYCESSEAFKSLFEYTKEEFDLLKEALN